MRAQGGRREQQRHPRHERAHHRARLDCRSSRFATTAMARARCISMAVSKSTPPTTARRPAGSANGCRCSGMTTRCACSRPPASCFGSIHAPRGGGIASTTTIGPRAPRGAPSPCSRARRPRDRPSARCARRSISTTARSASAACSAWSPSPRNTDPPSSHRWVGQRVALPRRRAAATVARGRPLVGHSGTRKRAAWITNLTLGPRRDHLSLTLLRNRDRYLSSHERTMPRTEYLQGDYARVPTTSMYSANTRVDPSVAMLFFDHRAVRSSRIAFCPAASSDPYARLVGP